MNILVSGAAGYVGRHLLPFLKSNTCSLFTPSIDQLDLSNYIELEAFFSKNKIDKVVHLAACLDNSNYESLFLSNIVALHNLLRVCLEYKIKFFVFVSGNNVYGSSFEKLFTEEDFCNPSPSNYYGLTKYCGELMVKDCFKNSKTKYSIIRIADIYGPNQKTGNLLKKVVENIKQKKPQIIFGTGVRTRDYIYIDDVARGIAFVTNNEIIGTYNLSTGKGTSVKEIVSIAEKISNCKEHTICVAAQQEDVSCVVLNNNKLKRKGFEPNVSFEDGLKTIVLEKEDTYD